MVDWLRAMQQIRVRFSLPAPTHTDKAKAGAIPGGQRVVMCHALLAQRLGRYLDMVEVTGSNPVESTELAETLLAEVGRPGSQQSQR